MFYIQKDGEVVSQVYKIEAESWEEAKAIAWDEMITGDILVECESDAIEQDERFSEFSNINVEKCTRYAMLERGVWISMEDGEEDFREDIYYFSDDPEEYLDHKGNHFDFD